MQDAVHLSLLETLAQLQQRVGCSEGTAMAFDPEALLPIQFAATGQIDPNRALVACRNEQRHVDIFKFRDLAAAPVPVVTLSTDSDPECGTSIRWQELNIPVRYPAKGGSAGP